MIVKDENSVLEFFTKKKKTGNDEFSVQTCWRGWKVPGTAVVLSTLMSRLHLWKCWLSLRVMILGSKKNFSMMEGI